MNIVVKLPPGWVDAEDYVVYGDKSLAWTGGNYSIIQCRDDGEFWYESWSHGRCTGGHAASLTLAVNLCSKWMRLRIDRNGDLSEGEFIYKRPREWCYSDQVMGVSDVYQPSSIGELSDCRGMEMLLLTSSVLVVGDSLDKTGDWWIDSIAEAYMALLSNTPDNISIGDVYVYGDCDVDAWEYAEELSEYLYAYPDNLYSYPLERLVELAFSKIGDESKVRLLFSNPTFVLRDGETYDDHATAYKERLSEFI